MADTRRNLFKTSILSIFGAMSGFAVVKAAAAEKSDVDESLGPILVRPKDGLVLLEPKENGDMRAYEVELKRGFTLPPDLSPRKLRHEPGVVLEAITDSRDLLIHDKKVLKIKNGVVSADDVKTMMADVSWTEIELSTFSWLEGPLKQPK